MSTGSLGPQTLTASFAGDSFYLPSSDASKTAIVFAFPSPSSTFTLGDSTVASAVPSTNVTWWGAKWQQLNSLSGGAAPAAFKGFAESVTLPSTSPANVCSGNWTSSGGNSAGPPATVPSYMGVIVANTITKSGSVVNGHYTRIVVVKTDSGYGPSPGHEGTGTIVATFCP